MNGEPVEQRYVQHCWTVFDTNYHKHFTWNNTWKHLYLLPSHTIALLVQSTKSKWPYWMAAVFNIPWPNSLASLIHISLHYCVRMHEHVLSACCSETMSLNVWALFQPLHTLLQFIQNSTSQPDSSSGGGSSWSSGKQSKLLVSRGPSTCEGVTVQHTHKINHTITDNAGCWE